MGCMYCHLPLLLLSGWAYKLIDHKNDAVKSALEDNNMNIMIETKTFPHYNTTQKNKWKSSRLVLLSFSVSN